jgi:hypothetical protein
MTRRTLASIVASTLLLGALLLGGISYARFKQQRRAALADRSFIATFESREPLHDEPGEQPGDRDLVYDDGRVIISQMPGYVYMVVYDYDTGVMREYIDNVLHSLTDVVEREKMGQLKAALTFSRSVTTNMSPTEVRSEEECLAIAELLRAGEVDEIVARYGGTVFQSDAGTAFVD